MTSPIRRAVVAGLVLAGLVNGAAARAAGQCSPSPAHDAFDIYGLQNELMVTALTCGLQDRYNSFTRKFNPSLLETERTLGAYFRATYGRGFQTEFDSYKTQLSLTQSEHGLKSGTALCGQRAAMFDEVAVLESAQDLAHYAQAKDIIQPASYETCAAPARTQHTETRTRARARATRATRSTRS